MSETPSASRREGSYTYLPFLLLASSCCPHRSTPPASLPSSRSTWFTLLSAKPLLHRYFPWWLPRRRHQNGTSNTARLPTRSWRGTKRLALLDMTPLCSPPWSFEMVAGCHSAIRHNGTSIVPLDDVGEYSQYSRISSAHMSSCWSQIADDRVHSLH